MELRESIESINEQLIRDYGREWNGMPRWQVVFSDDQFEKRITEFSDAGVRLLIPEVRLLPKYRQHIQQCYILERLVPAGPETDLVEKITYEPAWVFRNKEGNYLPPFFEGCKHVIESIYFATNPTNHHTKYKDRTTSPEQRLAELKKVEDELFGNESDVTDALTYGYGVVNALDSTKVDTTAIPIAKENEDAS